jgi:hypothetical protein
VLLLAANYAAYFRYGRVPSLVYPALVIMQHARSVVIDRQKPFKRPCAKAAEPPAGFFRHFIFEAGERLA